MKKTPKLWAFSSTKASSNLFPDHNNLITTEQAVPSRENEVLRGLGAVQENLLWQDLD